MHLRDLIIVIKDDLKAALAETLTPFQMTREGPLGKETTALSGIQDEIFFADAIAI